MLLIQAARKFLLLKIGFSKSHDPNITSQNRRARDSRMTSQVSWERKFRFSKSQNVFDDKVRLGGAYFVYVLETDKERVSDRKQHNGNCHSSFWDFQFTTILLFFFHEINCMTVYEKLNCRTSVLYQFPPPPSPHYFENKSTR